MLEFKARFLKGTSGPAKATRATVRAYLRSSAVTVSMALGVS